MESCIFCKIAKHEMPKDFHFEDEDVMVFDDIHPVAPIHFLVVTKKHFDDFMGVEHENLQKKLFKTIQNMVRKMDLDKKGFRLFVNGGGAQEIDHLHMHVVGPMRKGERLR